MALKDNLERKNDEDVFIDCHGIGIERLLIAHSRTSHPNKLDGCP
jgi:hypothetical protein